MNYPAFIDKEESDNLDEELYSILRKLKERKLQFLFGAGISGDVYPKGKELLNSLLEITYKKISEEAKEVLEFFPFEIIVEACEIKLGQRRFLTEYLDKIYLTPPNKMTPPKNIPDAFKYFEKLLYLDPKKIAIDRILTANFDRLFEIQLGEDKTETISFKNYHKWREAILEKKIPVFHLHGIPNEDRNYMITESDLISNLTNDFIDEFKTILKTSDIFIFIGYSMNDPDIKRDFTILKQDLNSRKDKTGFNTYTVMPVDSNDNGDQYNFGKKIWKARGVTWIPLDAKEFFQRLLKLNEDESKQDKVKTVKDSLGYNYAFEELIENFTENTGFDRDDILDYLSLAKRKKTGKKK